MAEETRTAHNYRVRPLHRRLVRIFRVHGGAYSDTMRAMSRAFMGPIFATARRYDDTLDALPSWRRVGRFDPKLERATGLLRLKKLYLEPGVRPSARLATSVARAMRDFMRFHAAGDLAVEHSEPSDFGARLTAAL